MAAKKQRPKVRGVEVAEQVWDIERNDLKAALAYYEYHLDRGDLTGDDVRVLMRLQDSFDKIEKAMDRVNERLGKYPGQLAINRRRRNAD